MFHYFNNLVNAANGNALPGYLVYVLDAGGTIIPIYSDESGTPIQTVSGYENAALSDAEGNYDLYVDDGTYSLQFRTITGSILDTIVNVPMISNVALVDLSADSGATLVGTASGDTVQQELDARVESSALAAPAGSSLVGFLQSGTGAVARTLQAKVRETVSITDFGAVPDSPNDATAAALAAVASLGPAGGFVEIPPGEYLMNVVIAQDNIVFRGKGGRGEFNDACIRPFSLLSPPITFGNDTTDYRYCGLENLHISGSNSDADAYHLAAKNAPQAVLLKGGTVNFTMFNCVLQGGIQTLALVPSMTNPVTVSKFIGCTIRNDIDDSASARSVYGIRRSTPDGGYLTSNKFIATKINGPDTGYAVEMDGTALGITSEWNDCYIDCAPGHGVMLKGSSAIVCYNLQIDPGTTGAVIIETDQVVADLTRYINGILRHGGQKMKFAGGTEIAMPAESDFFAYRGRLYRPYLGDFGFFTPEATPYDESQYYQIASGVFGMYGMKFRAFDTSEANNVNTGAIQSAGGISAVKSMYAGLAVETAGSYYVAGLKVVGARQAAIANPTDAATTQAAVISILDAMRTHGLIAT